MPEFDAAKLRQAIARAIEPQLRAACEEAKVNCPKDTGNLAGSIRVVMHGGGGTIAAAAPYAMHVEMGTAHMPARPYLYPAMRAHEAAIAQRAQQAAAAYLRACLNEACTGGVKRDSQ